MTVAGTLAAISSAWYIAAHDSLLHPVSTGILRGSFVFAWTITGVYTWWRRPESRLGPLGLGVAGVFAVSSLNGSPSALAYTLGMTFWAAYIVYLAYVYLSFPADHLGARLDRRLFAALAVATVVLWSLILLFADRLPIGGPFTDCSDLCPDNALQVVAGAPGLGKALASLFTVVTTAALVAVAIVLFLKTRAPSRLRRRTLEPVMYLVVASVLSFLLYRVVGSAAPGAKTALRYLSGAVSIAVPIAFLVGQIRGRMFAATRVGQLVASMQDTAVTPARVEALMRDTLGDPTLMLALSAPDSGAYVGVDGAALDLSGSDRRSSAHADRAGRDHGCRARARLDTRYGSSSARGARGQLVHAARERAARRRAPRISRPDRDGGGAGAPSPRARSARRRAAAVDGDPDQAGAAPRPHLGG